MKTLNRIAIAMMDTVYSIGIAVMNTLDRIGIPVLIFVGGIIAGYWWAWEALA